MLLHPMKALRLLPLLLLVCASGAVLRAEPAAPRINHIAFYVADLKTSADFYEKVLGLPVIPEPFKDGYTKNWLHFLTVSLGASFSTF